MPDAKPVRTPPRLTIGSVSRATGIPANTLRSWERRYGFPAPDRTDGGQRLYRAEVVEHLRLVARALDEGHRPRQILALPLGELSALLGAVAPASADPSETPAAWKRAVHGLDGETLMGELRRDSARNGALAFAVERVPPFLRWVGNAWASGEIAVHQEHFASLHVRAVLDECWRSVAPRTGAVVVCATLPGEQHDLGVLMAAVAVAAGGRRPLVLPGSTPPTEIAATVRATQAHAVAISLSAHASGPAFTQSLIELRGLLDPSVQLWVGGAGAPHEISGATVSQDLARLAGLAG